MKTQQGAQKTTRATLLLMLMAFLAGVLVTLSAEHFLGPAPAVPVVVDASGLDVLMPETSPAEIPEDDPRFDCRTMGNLVCGPDNAQGVPPGLYDQEGQLVDPDQVLDDDSSAGAVLGGPRT